MEIDKEELMLNIRKSQLRLEIARDEMYHAEKILNYYLNTLMLESIDELGDNPDLNAVCNFVENFSTENAMNMGLIPKIKMARGIFVDKNGYNPGLKETKVTFDAIQCLN